MDRRNGQRTDLKVAGPGTSTAVTRFDPPTGLSGAAVEAWEGFWADRPALLLTPSARVVLLRWIDALNRYLVATAAADAEPLVSGSTGQLRPSPLYAVAAQALRTAETAERQLGIGGLNAAALGLAAIAERRSLQELNVQYTPPAGQGGARDDAQDPRLTIVDPA